jgi:hypothetical protein
MTKTRSSKSGVNISLSLRVFYVGLRAAGWHLVCSKDVK